MRGPWDDSEVANDGTRLDLGCIRVPNVANLEIHVDLDEETQRGVGMSLVLPMSIAAVQVFARAKDEEMWPVVQEGIKSGLAIQDVESHIVWTHFGLELRSTMPTVDAEGKAIVQPVRFIGIDGPRWFLRIVVSGAAAHEEASMNEMDTLLKDIVVVRGNSPMPNGERLEIVLPSDPHVTSDDSLMSFHIEL